MTSEPALSEKRRPVLLITVGRQRVGKTTTLTTVAQYLEDKGARIRIWNADTMNKSASLSMFHADTQQPPTTDPLDIKDWLEARFNEQIRDGFDAILDIGGGATPLASLVEEVPVVAHLEQHGVRLVVMHVVGAEPADFDYMNRCLSEDLLAPKSTLIVCNGGLILNGRSLGMAFQGAYSHPATLSALGRGARITIMPRLACMSEVFAQRLRFIDAMTHQTDRSRPSLQLFDQARVEVWWKKHLPDFFAKIPADWLPHTVEPIHCAAPLEAASHV